jgi:hypothetical protein
MILQEWSSLYTNELAKDMNVIVYELEAVVENFE